MDYFNIIKRAWRITWQNKFLWIFGFFAAAASGASFNFSFPSNGTQNATDQQMYQIYQQAVDFLAEYWLVFTLIGLALFFIFLIFFVLNIVSCGALIACVDKIENKKPTNFKDGFQIGFFKFWKIFGLRIFLTVLIFLALIILVGPIIALFIFNMPGRALILLLLALVIFLPLIFVLSFVLNYALRYLVLKNAKIFNSMGLALELLKKNILQTIVIFLILMLAGFAVGISVLIVMLFIFLPSLFFGIAAYFIGKWLAVTIVAGLAILLFFGAMALISAIFNTFSSATWTLTFLEMEKKGP